MKLIKKIKKNKFVQKGILYAIFTPILWPIIGLLLALAITPIEFALGYKFYPLTSTIYTFVAITPPLTEILLYIQMPYLIILRFGLFIIFGYFNGLLYEKLHAKFNHSKLYFIVTTLLFYYLVLAAIVLADVLFFGGTIE